MFINRIIVFESSSRLHARGIDQNELIDEIAELIAKLDTDATAERMANERKTFQLIVSDDLQKGQNVVVERIRPLRLRRMTETVKIHQNY